VAFRAGNGVRVRETVRGTKADAERRLTELLREHDVTGLVPDREQTVATVSKAWLDHVAHRVKPTTLKRYRELLAVHVIPSLGPVRMTELRSAAVSSTITKVLEIRSPRTGLNTYRVRSEMLGEAVRWGVIATNAAAAIRPPRAPRPKLNIPDADTCAEILVRVRGQQIQGPVTVALGTGMRLGEILALAWDDVDLDSKVLRVRQGRHRARAAAWIFRPSSPTTSPRTARSRRYGGGRTSAMCGPPKTSYSTMGSVSRSRRGRSRPGSAGSYATWG
jgi:integrase